MRLYSKGRKLIPMEWTLQETQGLDFSSSTCKSTFTVGWGMGKRGAVGGFLCMSLTSEVCMMALPLHMTKSLFSLGTAALARIQVPSGQKDAAPPAHSSMSKEGTKAKRPTFRSPETVGTMIPTHRDTQDKIAWKPEYAKMRARVDL